MSFCHKIPPLPEINYCLEKKIYIFKKQIVFPPELYIKQQSEDKERDILQGGNTALFYHSASCLGNLSKCKHCNS